MRDCVMRSEGLWDKKVYMGVVPLDCFLYGEMIPTAFSFTLLLLQALSRSPLSFLASHRIA